MAYTANLMTAANLTPYAAEGQTEEWHVHASTYYIGEGVYNGLPDRALYIDGEYGDPLDTWWTGEEIDHDASTEVWLAARFKLRRRITKVGFYFNNYARQYMTDVTLQGSNDSTDGSDGTWTTIATELDNTPSGGLSDEWSVEHEIENASFYRWYRVVASTRYWDYVDRYALCLAGWLMYGIEGESDFTETEPDGAVALECIKGDRIKINLDIYNPHLVAQQVRIDLMDDPPLLWPAMSFVRDLPLIGDIICSYPFGGIYALTATLLNFDGSEEDPVSPGIVRVYDIPQIESPTATPTEGYGEIDVTFSWTPYEAGGIAEYELDDGAGNVTTLAGTATTATIRYEAAGIYHPKIRARMLNGKWATVMSEVAYSTPQTFTGDGVTGNGERFALAHQAIKPGTVTASTIGTDLADWSIDHAAGILSSETDLGSQFITILGYTHYVSSGDNAGWVMLPTITLHAAPGDLAWQYLTPLYGSGTGSLSQTVSWGLLPTSAVADIVDHYEIDWDDGSDIESVDNALSSATHAYAVGDVREHEVQRDSGYLVTPKIRWVAIVEEETITGEWYEDASFRLAPTKPTISTVTPVPTQYLVRGLLLGVTIEFADPDSVAEKIIVDWGDGVRTEFAAPATDPLSVHALYQYENIGTYTVKISVTSGHYTLSDSSVTVMVVSDLVTKTISKTQTDLTVRITHTTDENLDGIGRTIQVQWGDE